MFEQIAPMLQNILLAIIVIIVPYGVKLLTQYISTKIKNDKINDAINLIGDIVVQVNQTYVDDLKEKNMFTEAAQKEAFTKAFNLAKVLIAEKTQELIKETYTDFDKWLTTQIEANVYYQ